MANHTPTAEQAVPHIQPGGTFAEPSCEFHREPFGGPEAAAPLRFSFLLLTGNPQQISHCNMRYRALSGPSLAARVGIRTLNWAPRSSPCGQKRADADSFKQ